MAVLGMVLEMENNCYDCVGKPQLGGRVLVLENYMMVLV